MRREPKQPQQESKSSSVWQWAIIGVAGLVTMAIVGKLLSSKKSSKGDKEEEELKERTDISNSSMDNFMGGEDDDDFASDEDIEGNVDENSAEWEMLITRAESLKHKGKFQESDSCFEKAYEIMKSSFKEDHSFIALLFASWAPVLTFLKKYEKAEEILKK
jgi:tetratricopeptide (TPR) repeat protein